MLKHLPKDLSGFHVNPTYSVGRRPEVGAWPGSFELKSLFEKVRDLVTGLLRIVDGHLGSLLRSLTQIFAGIVCRVVG